MQVIWYLILAISLPHYGAISTAAYAGMIKAGSKPTERTAANSSEESDDPQVPLRLISAILASATGGKSSLLTASSLAWRLLLRVPGLVAFLNFVERVGGLLARRVRAEQILARAGGVEWLDGVVAGAEVPLLFVVVGHAH